MLYITDGQLVASDPVAILDGAGFWDLVQKRRDGLHGLDNRCKEMHRVKLRVKKSEGFITKIEGRNDLVVGPEKGIGDGHRGSRPG